MRCRPSPCAIAAPVSAPSVRDPRPRASRHEAGASPFTRRWGIAVEFLEFRIQIDSFELFLPVRLGHLEGHLLGRLGGRLFVGNRFTGRAVLLDGIGDGDIVGKLFAVLHDCRDTPRSVDENRTRRAGHPECEALVSHIAKIRPLERLERYAN